MQVEQLAPVWRHDGELARQRLVHHDAERVDVRARLDLGADALLRRHVLGRAQRVARLRQRLRGRKLAHAEVEDLRDAVLAQKDVAGLEVAVDDPLLVRGV